MPPCGVPAVFEARLDAALVQLRVAGATKTAGLQDLLHAEPSYGSELLRQGPPSAPGKGQPWLYVQEAAECLGIGQESPQPHPGTDLHWGCGERGLDFEKLPVEN